jgi:hypothetical protein
MIQILSHCETAVEESITGQEAACILFDIEIVTNGQIGEAVFQGDTSEDTGLARRRGHRDVQ